MSVQPGEGIELVILGAGGHGSEVAAYCVDMEHLRPAGFIDEGKRGRHGGIDILGDLGALRTLCIRSTPRAVHYITALGSNEARKRLVEKLRSLDAANLIPWKLLHPNSYRGVAVDVLEGTCVAPGAILTTQVRIGRHCIVNVNASVSHDCIVGDFCNLNPGSVLCGNVTLGEGCYIGAGATVKERVTIGAWTTVGAGAVVVEDLPSGVTAAGVPARVIGAKS